VPSNIVVGTSLMQIVATMAAAALLYAATSQSVDVVLGLILMVGGVIGAQFGARAGAALRGEQLRFLLALLVLAVAARFLYDLVAPPEEPFSISRIAGAGL
jgi:uncharacterized membrane protein YfcA